MLYKENDWRSRSAIIQVGPKRTDRPSWYLRVRVTTERGRHREHTVHVELGHNRRLVVNVVALPKEFIG